MQFMEYTGSVHNRPILNEQITRFADIFRCVVGCQIKKGTSFLDMHFLDLLISDVKRRPHKNSCKI